MKTSLVAPALVLALSLSVSACSGDDGPATASDPAAPGAPAS